MFFLQVVFDENREIFLHPLKFSRVRKETIRRWDETKSITRKTKKFKWFKVLSGCEEKMGVQRQSCP